MAETGGLFIADAEENNLDEFDSTFVQGTNTIAAAAAAKNQGSYGFLLSYSGSDNQIYGEKAFTEEAEVYARIYFRFDANFNLAAWQIYTILTIYDGTIVGGTLIAEVAAMNLTGSTAVPGYVDINGASITETWSAFTWEVNTFYLVELRYKSNNGAGGAEAWINEVKKVTKMDENTSANGANRIVMGSVIHVGPNAACEVWMDDLKLDTSYIGAYSDAGGGIVVLRRRRM